MENAVGAWNRDAAYRRRMKSILHGGVVALALCGTPAHARFLSVDPVTPDPATGRDFNRYAYANGAPFTYVDPDGRLGLRPYHEVEGAQVLPTEGPPIAILPTDSGIVTASFGARLHPVTGEPDLHNGTDFRARQDAPVRSTQNGQVRAIRAGGPGGNQLLVDNHDGSLSGYAHVSVPEGLREGDSVTRGQVIGTSDGSGRVTAPHLHYTYRPGTLHAPASPGTPPVDPMRTQLRRYPKRAR